MTELKTSRTASLRTSLDHRAACFNRKQQRTNVMIKYRKSTWHDMIDNSPVYGIKVNRDGEWEHLSQNGSPIFFKREEDRDRKLASLRDSQRHI